MHGIGNDFVLLDERVNRTAPDVEDAELARNICDRRFGVGADGLIFVEPGALAPIRMRMLNPDGSASEMCGNGLRCVAKLVGGDLVQIETGGRRVEAELLPDGRIRIDMGLANVLDPHLRVDEFEGVSIDVGNPHFVVFCEDLDILELEHLGPRIEHAPVFPARTNVHFAKVIDSRTIRQRTWERGAGITLACGSGACAGAVAAFATGRTGPEVRLHLPGGFLDLQTNEAGQVWMTGPAESVFSGEFRLP